MDVWSTYLETLEALLNERDPGWMVFNLADEVAQFKPADGFWMTITGVELRAEGTPEAAVDYIIARAQEELAELEDE